MTTTADTDRETAMTTSTDPPPSVPCAECGRPLRRPESRARRRGPVCHRFIQRRLELARRQENTDRTTDPSAS
jgi:hypothetical protein